MKNTKIIKGLFMYIACMLFSTSAILAQVQTAKYITTNPRSNAFYEYLPQGYNSGNESYPLIVFIHGLGELGAGTSATLPYVLRNGPPKQISQGQFPTSFTVNGVTSKFIVISPQFTEWPGPSDINILLNYLIQNYRVDQSRIYMTGLSMGGGVVWEYAGSSPVYANRLAAIVPICGASWPDQGRAQTIAGANLGVWATHNDGDPTAPVFYTNDYITYINSAPTPPSPLAKKTIFSSNSHDAWSQTYNLNFRENGLNIYEWFLTRSRVAVFNPPPVVNAGSDLTINLPVNSVRFQATASDPGGSISIIRWTKVSGPATGLIENPTGLWTNMVNLVQGVYVFRLSVTDNGGALTYDDVTVTVNGSGQVNIAPVANAGADKVISLPVNTTTLTGSASDQDGTVSSYAWTKFSGPAAGTISSPSAATTGLAGLSQGTYVFRLTVTDNSGATNSDDVNVVVNAAIANQLPVASAGADKTITLPVNITSLSGSGTDADGTISSYAWTKFSGPSAGTISSPSAATTGITGLSQGTYVFRLTVTDNTGATNSDDVNVVVNAATANQLPVASAGADKTITLPVNITSLSGSGTDADGTISSYSWTKFNGPAGGSISSSSSANTNITGLNEGTYTFRLIVTDNAGASSSDDVNVTVQPQVVVPPPGSGKSIKVNVYGGSNAFTNTEWNNWNTNNLTSSNFFYNDQTASNVNATITSQAGVADNGATYATNAVTVPYQVLRYNSFNTSNRTLTVRGLIPSQKYSLQFFGSRANTGNKTVVLINNSTDTINTDNNANDFASFTNISPDGNGTLSVDLYRIGTYNYLAGFIITEGSSSLPPVINIAPVANAGSDISITLPVNTATITGAGTDQDGNIIAYAWTKVSGPSAGLITQNNSASTGLSGLVQGTYVFRLTVTDNSGATNSDDVTIVVNAAAANVLPVANAGTDNLIVLPVNSSTLSGSATDADGSIASYTWTKFNGPASGTITSSSSASTTVTGLTAGNYTFRLTVTDNSGGSSSDDVIVTVAAETPPPPTSGRKIKVNVFGGSNAYNNTQWNNWNTNNLNSTTFKYEDQSNSTVTASITAQAGVADNGSGYASTATVVAPEILRYNSYNTSNRTLTLKGLTPGQSFSLQVFGSRQNTGNKTVVQAGNISDTINTDNNSTDYAQLSGLIADNNGQLIVELSRIGTYNYLAGFILSEENLMAKGIMTTSTVAPLAVLSTDPELKFLYNIEMYPNPVQQTMNVKIVVPQENTQVMLTLVDAMGKVVYQKQIMQTQKTQLIQINVSQLINGVYTLNMRANGKNISREIIKGAVN